MLLLGEAEHDSHCMLYAAHNEMLETSLLSESAEGMRMASFVGNQYGKRQSMQMPTIRCVYMLHRISDQDSIN